MNADKPRLLLPHISNGLCGSVEWFSEIDLATGTALRLLMVVLLGAGGAASTYSFMAGGMGDMMGMAQCGNMDMDCSQDHALCQQHMQDRPGDMDSACESMGMSYEECLAMHDQMASGMMPASCH